MSQIKRDEALRRFAAEVVMEWHAEASSDWAWQDSSGRNQAHPNWNPLESGNDAFWLWERARENGDFISEVCAELYQIAMRAKFNKSTLSWFVRNATPRLITEAICTAFGFQWREEEDAK